MIIFLFLAVIIVSVGVFSVSFGISIARKIDWQVESGVIVSSHIQKDEDLRGTVELDIQVEWLLK